MLNVDTNSRLTPNVFRPRNSRQVVKPSSKLSSSVRHDPPRSFLRNSLDHTRSLHDPAHTPSPYDFRTVFALYTRYSTSQFWSQPFRTLFPIESSLLHLRSWSMTNWNSRFPRYWTPRLTTCLQIIVPCLLDRLRRHRQRNLVDTCFWTRTHFQTRYGIPHQVPDQAWPSVKAFLTPVFLCSHFFYVQSQFNFLSTQPRVISVVEGLFLM